MWEVTCTERNGRVGTFTTPKLAYAIAQAVEWFLRGRKVTIRAK